MADEPQTLQYLVQPWTPKHISILALPSLCQLPAAAGLVPGSAAAAGLCSHVILGGSGDCQAGAGPLCCSPYPELMVFGTGELVA